MAVSVATSSIGQKVKQYRKERKMSQKQLAKDICSISAISLIEADKIRPTIELLEKIASKLNIEVSRLVNIIELPADDVDYILLVAKLLMQKGQSPEALQAIDRLENLSLNQQYTVQLLRAECHLRMGDRILAIEQLQLLIGEIQHNAFFDAFTRKAHKLLGAAYYYQQDMSSSYHHYQLAYEVCLRSRPVEPSFLADLAHNLGMVCIHLSKHEEAESFLRRAYQFYEQVSDLSSLADTYYALGISTRNEMYLHKALELYESLGIIREANMARQFQAYHFTGEITLELVWLSVPYKTGLGLLLERLFLSIR